MLQGHPSLFWGELYDGLAADGHAVFKIHFCLADRIFWGARPGISYRGFYRNWQAWLSQFVKEQRITDILYYADRLPYHIDALSVGRDAGAKCWAMEFGYLRPDWITMEPEAMGAGSLFPKDPDRVSAMAEGVTEPDLTNRYPHRFASEAFFEVTYHLLQAYGRPFYPLYNSDKIYWPAIDYISWLAELFLDHRRKAAAEDLEARVKSGEIRYNLVAMQIQADYQIRASSPYDHLSTFLEEVMTSFKRAAPNDRELIIKLHPLDNGLERWFKRIPKLAEKAGLSSRVHVVKGGELLNFLKHSEGAVLVNSTVGIHALRLGVPTYAAGSAIFDIPGLTHQSELDQFWTHADPVDATLFGEFQRALLAVQIKGSFFNKAGRQAAVREVAARLRGQSA